MLWMQSSGRGCWPMQSMYYQFEAGSRHQLCLNCSTLWQDYQPDSASVLHLHCLLASKKPFYCISHRCLIQCPPRYISCFFACLIHCKGLVCSFLTVNSAAIWQHSGVCYFEQSPSSTETLQYWSFAEIKFSGAADFVLKHGHFCFAASLHEIESIWVGWLVHL